MTLQSHYVAGCVDEKRHAAESVIPVLFQLTEVLKYSVIYFVWSPILPIKLK